MKKTKEYVDFIINNIEIYCRSNNIFLENVYLHLKDLVITYNVSDVVIKKNKIKFIININQVSKQNNININIAYEIFYTKESLIKDVKNILNANIK